MKLVIEISDRSPYREVVSYETDCIPRIGDGVDLEEVYTEDQGVWFVKDVYWNYARSTVVLKCTRH